MRVVQTPASGGTPAEGPIFKEISTEKLHGFSKAHEHLATIYITSITYISQILKRRIELYK